MLSAKFKFASLLINGDINGVVYGGREHNGVIWCIMLQLVIGGFRRYTLDYLSRSIPPAYDAYSVVLRFYN